MPTTTLPTTERYGLIARSARIVNKLRPRSGYDVVAVVAMCAALGTGGAYASNMITGANVEDGSLTGLDVQDGSITAVDLGTALSTHSSGKTVDPGALAQFTILCPPGKKPVGGGFDTYTADLSVRQSRPGPGNSGWYLLVHNTSASKQVVAAYAQCAGIS